MADASWHLQGEMSYMKIDVNNDGADTPTLIASRWIHTPEDKRVALITIQLGAKVFTIRFEFIDALFREMTLLGKPIASDFQHF